MSASEAIAYAEKRLAEHYWIFGKGRTHPDEPLYGLQIFNPDDPEGEPLAEAEDSDPVQCVLTAIQKLEESSEETSQ